MRETLAKIDGARGKYRGVFVRYGVKSGYQGRTLRTLLFAPVYDANGEVAAEHIWFTECAGFKAISELSPGEEVLFRARVKPYTKGYYSPRHDIDFRERDYKLSHPSDIRLLIQRTPPPDDGEPDAEAVAAFVTGIRVVHVKRHPYDTYIGRENKTAGLPGSKWGNPFFLPNGAGDKEREECLDKYEGHVLASPALVAALEAGELIGKDIACWCKKEPDAPKPLCHGDKLRLLQARLWKGNGMENPTNPAPTGAVIEPKKKGDIKSFANSSTITQRRIYKEQYGTTTGGQKVLLGLAYNSGGPGNVWFVLLVAVGSEMYSIFPFSQTKTCPNVAGVRDGFLSAVGDQLRKITGSKDFILHKAQRPRELEDAIKGVWPAGVPMNGEVSIAPEHSAARRNATQAVNRATRKEEAETQKEERKVAAVNAGKVEPGIEQPTLFEF